MEKQPLMTWLLGDQTLLTIVKARGCSSCCTVSVLIQKFSPGESPGGCAACCGLEPCTLLLRIPAPFPQTVFQTHDLLPLYLQQPLAARGSLCPGCWTDTGSAAAITSGHQQPRPIPPRVRTRSWLSEEIFAGHCCRQQACLGIHVVFLITVRPGHRLTTWGQLLVLAQGAGRRRICL